MSNYTPTTNQYNDPRFNRSDEEQKADAIAMMAKYAQSYGADLVAALHYPEKE